jgi:ribosome-associated toxin RatA of RatAB toxin-antitoxin module
VSLKIKELKFLKDWWKKGPLVIIEEKPDGKLKFITSAILVNAPIDVVWDTILDFENYNEFMESVKIAEILEESEKHAVVKYTIEFRFLRVISLSVKYTTKLTLKKPKRIDFKLIDGPFPNHYGYWELTPHEKNKIILCYGVYTDVSKITLARIFLSRNPLIESAMGVSTSTIVIKSIKNRAEGRKW